MASPSLAFQCPSLVSKADAALADATNLSTADSKDLNERLRAQGFEVYDPDVSMFTRGGGGVHCMCQPLRRDRV